MAVKHPTNARCHANYYYGPLTRHRKDTGHKCTLQSPFPAQSCQMLPGQRHLQLGLQREAAPDCKVCEMSCLRGWTLILEASVSQTGLHGTRWTKGRQHYITHCRLLTGDTGLVKALRSPAMRNSVKHFQIQQFPDSLHHRPLFFTFPEITSC